MPRRFSEIALRGGFDAVGAGAEIDPVEIKLEDLRLGEFVFEPECQHHFLRLARDRALLGEKQILGELLGDGRTALRGAPPQHVGDQRAHDAQRIDAVVGVETAILDGDERLGHIVGQVVQRHRGAAHIAAGRKRRAIEAEDQDRRRAFGNFERLDGRQMDADPDQNADGADDRPQGEDGGPINQTAGAGTAFAAAAAAGLFLFCPGRGFFVRAAASVAPFPWRAADAVLRAYAKIEALGVAGALAAVSPGHVPSPRASQRVADDGRECGLRGGYSLFPSP